MLIFDDIIHIRPCLCLKVSYIELFSQRYTSVADLDQALYELQTLFAESTWPTSRRKPYKQVVTHFV